MQPGICMFDSAEVVEISCIQRTRVLHMLIFCDHALVVECSAMLLY